MDLAIGALMIVFVGTPYKLNCPCAVAFNFGLYLSLSLLCSFVEDLPLISLDFGRKSFTDMEALRVENLSKRFGGVQALSEVSFSLDGWGEISDYWA